MMWHDACCDPVLQGPLGVINEICAKAFVFLHFTFNILSRDKL